MSDDQARPNEANYLRTLLQLGTILNVSLDVSQVLQIAIDEVVKFVGAERGFVLLVDHSTKRVSGMATHGIDALELESALSGRDRANIPQVSRTIVDEALRDRRLVLSTNAMEDPRYSAKTSVQLSNLRSVLCVPLIAQGQTLGIVYLDSRIRTCNFDDRDAEMLTAFANQAAVAIQNARLYENLRRSMEERLQLQEEITAKETERRALEEANRLKSEFIGMVAHELRNPLTVIRGYVQTLQSDAGGPVSEAERREFYEIIEAEADRMLTMIAGLLDSSRLEAGRDLPVNLKSIDLRLLLQRLARTQRFGKHWTPKHRLVVEIAPDLPKIEADEDKVVQIVQNLLSNAVKYSPDGGDIRLEAAPAEGGVAIRVTDHGIGLSEEQVGRLFGRYERLDREEIKQISGTGLGLYLTRHLVGLHHGRIDVRSAPGEGSTFEVFLPLVPAS